MQLACAPPNCTYFSVSGQQSLLDDLYEGLFTKWIVSTFLFNVAMTLWEINVSSWTLSMIFGWPSCVLVIRSHIHLMFCGIVKFGLTFHLGEVEQIPEKVTKRFIW